MPRTRANGEGAIYKRADGLWTARYFDANGKRHDVYGKTRKAVADKLDTARKALAEGLPVLDERQTLGAFLNEWLTLVAPTLKTSSAHRYELAVTNHIAPAIGGVSLARLGPQHVQSMLAGLAEQGLAPATICHVHNVLRAALAQAERFGRVHRNVARLVSPPRIPRHEMQTLTPEEAQRVIAAADGERFGALYVLLLATGLRIGEALALTWANVNLDAGTVHIVGTLSRTRQGYTVTEPKTAGSRRSVMLPAVAVKALKMHRSAQLEARLAAGSLWHDADFVFCDGMGGSLTPDGTVRKAWIALLVSAGVPRIRIHDARHTAATLLLGRGVHAKIVSEQLGHSSIKKTLDLYSHVTPAMARTAAEAMDAALGG